MREARTAARLRHPNVAAVHHFGTLEFDPGLGEVHPGGIESPAAAARCFYAMEFIEGETLEARVRRAGPLEAVRALEMVRQVAAALEAAEARGLVHRDLKPSNIMLAGDAADKTNYSHPGSDWVKVIDFGLAKAVDAVARGHGWPDLRRLADAWRFRRHPAVRQPGAVRRRERGHPLGRLFPRGVTLWYRADRQMHRTKATRPLPSMTGSSTGRCPWGS